MIFLRPIEVFGDITVLTGTTYPGTVIALEDVQVWAIPANALLDLIRRSPDLSMAIIRHLGRRVLHYVNLVEDLSLRSVEARLGRTLLQYAELRAGQLVEPVKEWGLRTLGKGLLRLEKQIPAALEAMRLQHRAYRQVASDALMTVLALLLGIVGTIIFAERRFGGLSLGTALAQIVAWFFSVLLMYLAGRLLCGRGTYTSTLRVMGFAQGNICWIYSLFLTVIASVVRFLFSLLAFIGV